MKKFILLAATALISASATASASNRWPVTAEYENHPSWPVAVAKYPSWPVENSKFPRWPVKVAKYPSWPVEATKYPADEAKFPGLPSSEDNKYPHPGR